MAPKIDDFGRVIHGAAKHKARQWLDRAAIISDETTAREPLSKSFPAPDYAGLVENGHDPFKVGIVRAFRDAIPKKPRSRSGRELLAWVSAVSQIRNVCVEFIENEAMARDEVLERLNSIKSNVKPHLIFQAEAYARLGHDQMLGDYKVHRVTEYGKTEGRYQVCKVDGYIYREKFQICDTENEAVDAFITEMAARSALAAERSDAPQNDGDVEWGKMPARSTPPRAKKAAAPKLYVTPAPGGKLLFAKLNRGQVNLGVFPTKESAADWARNNGDVVQQRLEAARQNPDQRRDTNSDRQGPSRRRGHVSPAEFREVFGEIGGQFGESLPLDERQAALNNAHDSLIDLAEVLGLEPRSLLLNGQLGLAFGARGKGGKGAAAAHYEPGEMVINLTRRNGAGSFAHEWFHALDHAICMRSGGARDGFMTQSVLSDHETLHVKRGLVEALSHHPVCDRSIGLDRYRANDYYSTMVEMAARGFEAFVIDDLAKRGQNNDWLANILDKQTYNALNELCGRSGDLYPYPEGEYELAPLRAHYRAVVNEAIRLGILEPAVAEPEAALDEALAPEPTSALLLEGEDPEMETAPVAERREPMQLSFGW